MSRVNNNPGDSAKKFIPGLGRTVFIQEDEIEFDLVAEKDFLKLAKKVSDSLDTVDKLAVPQDEYQELLDAVSGIREDVNSMMLILSAMHRVSAIL